MSDDNPNVGIGTTPNVQSLGKDVDVPQVGTHCVVPGSPDSQPSQAVTAPRTGFTSLCQRIAATLTSIRQFFTRRTPPAVSSPTIIAEPPLKSPDAADAGYQTASLVVGETPLRIYAKNAETLGEIQRILSQPDLRSDGEILSRATRAMKSLGFPETAVDLASSGLSMGVINVSGYVTGNEDKRQQAVQREDTQVGSFQSCQTPDRAKIAGAKALVELNSLSQTLEECATKRVVMEKLISICNNPEHQVTSLEWNVGGNSVFDNGRTYNPLLSGLKPVFCAMLKDSENNFSCEHLQEFAREYGHEFLEQMVKSAYLLFSKADSTRPQLKNAYEAYCRESNKTPIDLDGLLFNPELRKILKMQEGALEIIGKMDLPQKANKTKLAEQCQQNAEQMFHTWLQANKRSESDGSCTIDLGHIKIMVNEDQLGYVTLKSLDAL